MTSEIKPNITIKQLRKIFPDLETVFLKIGRSEIVKFMSLMPKSGNYALDNASRAAGLTEIEIELLVDELNDRKEGGRTQKRIVPKIRFKAGSRKSKHKARK